MDLTNRFTVRVTDGSKIRELGLSTVDVMDTVTRFFSHQLFVSGNLHADPHPGNILVRVRPGTKNKLDVVIIDHGLYCHEPEDFRKNYAQLWRSIITGDTEGVKQVASTWGIRDHELFASFQLFRPYKGSRQATPVTKAVTKAELLELQASVKDRVVRMLSDSSKVPPELSLVGRNLNLIRSLNKSLDSPINRPKIMAIYANRGVGKKAWLDDLWFQFSLGFVEFGFVVAESWRSVFRRITGVDSGGFEALLEKQLSANVEQQLGFKINHDVDGGIG